MLYITQRSAALNKNVLDQADTLIVMRTIGPRDRAAIEGWVKHQDAAGMDQVLPSLPSLQTGEAWIWTPERGLLERVQVRKARTFDSSVTPKAGQTAIVANVKPIDVDALGEAIKATVERAKASDPAELRKRVRELEAKLAQAPAEQEVETVVERVEVPVPVFNGEVERLEDVVRGLVQASEQLGELAPALRETSSVVASAIAAARAGGTERVSPAVQPRPTRPSAEAAARAPARPPAPAPAPQAVEATSTGALGGAAGAVLSALAQFPDGRTRRQLAGLTGYRATGSTMRGALAQLRKLGYCTAAGTEPIQATAAGIAAAGDVDVVPTGAALYAYWYAKLGGASRAVLELLYRAYPNGVSREEIAEHTGYELGGSTLRGALAELRKFDLATQAGVEPIRASDTLFEEAAA
jgi:hypothetical protein